MPLDWNWFFSSLSQSAAAIVGIFGAFIITKIFSNQTVFREKNTSLRDLLIQAQKISDTANSYDVEWYNETYNRLGYKKFQDYLDEELPDCEFVDEVTEQVLNEFIARERFSKFSEGEHIKQALQKITTAVFRNNKKKRELNEAAAEQKEQLDKLSSSLLGTLGGALRLAHMTQQQTGRSIYKEFVPQPALPIERLDKIKDGLKESHLQAKHHARLASEFLDSIEGNPESPPQITYALALVLCIFFVGVIYPLSFMPAGGAPVLGLSWDLIVKNVFSFKGYLLGVISLAFSVIVALFFNTHANMRYAADKVDRIKELTNVESYCRYFKFFSEKD